MSKIRKLSLMAILALGGVPAALASQSTIAPLASALSLPERQFESREQLTARARAAEAQGRAEEAFVLRARLQNGDFREGDRIVVAMLNSPTPAPPETLVVRAGKVLQFAAMDSLSLHGVIRSELSTTLTRHLATYLRQPNVRATPLLRLTVTGRVARPGFIYTAADVILSDVIMSAGGPAADADLNNIVIRRGTSILWNGEQTRTALADGLSLDRLDLRAGDEIEIGLKKQRSWSQVIPILSSLAVVLSITGLIRR